MRVAGAQMGPTQKADSREHTLGRMFALLEQSAAAGARLVVFPELAFTTFFPRWFFADAAELDAYFERGMPNPATQPLFDRARALGVGFYVGYAELTDAGQRFNTAILVAPEGNVIGTYRKVHLPGSVEPRDGARFQQLEKRYFEYGDLGFPDIPCTRLARRRRAGDDDLQRPSLAGGVARARARRRRTGLCRLQLRRLRSQRRGHRGCRPSALSTRNWSRRRTPT